jgi:hypothetical protein
LLALVSCGWGFFGRNPPHRNPGGFDLASVGPDGVEGTADDVPADVLFAAPPAPPQN